MKKRIVCCFVFLFLMCAANISFGGAHELLLPDFLGVPSMGNGWDATYPTEGFRTYTVQRTKLNDGEYFAPLFKIQRIEIDKKTGKNWKKFVEERLSGLYSKPFPVQNSEVEGDNFQASYSFTEHYLPIKGHAIAARRGEYIYIIECQKQQPGSVEKASIEEMCVDYYNNIIWPEDMAFKSDKKDFLSRWAKIDFDRAGISREYEKLSRRHAAKTINESLIKDYVGLLITESLYLTGSRDAASVLNDFSLIEQKFGPDLDPNLITLMQIHRNYLNGNYELVQSTLASMVSTTSSVPYWLLSRWIADKDQSAAFAFAERSILSHPSCIANYTKAGLLYRTGSFEESVKHLKKCGQGNSMVLALLASNYIALGDVKRAESYVRKAERKDPKDVELLSVKAKIYRSQKNDDAYEKAEQTYSRIAELPGISREKRVQNYYDWAEHVFDPNQKIELYNKVIALKKDDPKVYYDLGKVYLVEKRDYRNAAANFRKYLKIAKLSRDKKLELRGLIWKLEGQM